MFTVRVETSFQAPHQLTLPDGSKESLHCHDWLVRARLCGQELNRMGLLVDFNRIKALLDEVVDTLADGRLEKNDFFSHRNSSAENIAKYIYDKLDVLLPENVTLKNVEVFEQPGCSATYNK